MLGIYCHIPLTFADIWHIWSTRMIMMVPTTTKMMITTMTVIDEGNYDDKDIVIVVAP